MYEKLVSGFREQFFSRQRLFSNFDFTQKFTKEIEGDNEKVVVDKAIRFPKISILRPLVFIETTRQRGSLILSTVNSQYSGPPSATNLLCQDLRK